MIGSAYGERTLAEFVLINRVECDIASDIGHIFVGSVTQAVLLNGGLVQYQLMSYKDQQRRT